MKAPPTLGNQVRRNLPAVARLTTGVLAALLVLAGVLPAGALRAQEATPNPMTTPVHIWNPSGSSTSGPGLELSNKDMAAAGYQLLASVGTVADQVVLFELENSNERREIGLAEHVEGDIWRLPWAIPDQDALPSGSWTLRAIVFSGSQEVAQHELSVTVDNEREAVRLEHPISGGPAGFFRPNAESSWVTVLNFTYSTDATRVQAFFTKSLPGDDPEWASCGTANVLEGPGSAAVRCALGADDHPAEITGVAVVAGAATGCTLPVLPGVDCLLPQVENHSGDAGRVFPYLQVPSELTLAVEGGATGYGVGQCTQQIVVGVTDQAGRPIPRVNIDVHATGPQESGGATGLRFDVSNETDPNQAPDQGHSNQIAGWDCADEAVSSTMTGNHRSPFGPDTRHIESQVSGTGQRTDDNGQFRFRLRSDTPGETQITAWADLSDDDLYCTEEPAAHIGIGWGQEAPEVEPHAADTTFCPAPFEPGPSLPGPPSGDEVDVTCGGHTVTKQENEIYRQPNPEDPSGELIVGTPGNENLTGTEGNDIICGLGGNDTIRGLGGDDKIFGGPGNDNIFGGPGRDVIRGGPGKDTIRGGPGHDRLFGGRGDDVLKGGRGNDFLNGGPGFDRCFGGPGKDTFRNCSRTK